MERITGLGGVFFKSRDKSALGTWYREHLGVDVQDWGGTSFSWRDASEPDRVGGTVWSLFAQDTKYFSPGTGTFMLNYRVRDLDRMLAQLRAAGVTVDDKVEQSDFGRFGWGVDPEGNRFELWQPPESERSGIACYVVDAFTSRAFGGNPAAVCPLDAWIDEARMQRIARENNLSETAFVVPRAATGSPHEYDLRWFTPAVEVDLCGHATLATAHVLFAGRAAAAERVLFHTKSGPLEVTRGADGALVMDFPSRAASPANAPPGLAAALGASPRETLRWNDTLVALLDEARAVRALDPDPRSVAAVHPEITAVVVAANGTGDDADVDFVSRFFAPRKGVAEDPVTGSSHTILGPLFAARLGKTTLRARQVSARGGELTVEPRGDRVRIGGRAVLVKSGVIHATEE